MPVANKYDLKDVLDACDYYFAQTGRRMTYEYSLVGGVNDTEEDLAGLVGMLKGKNCHINLIPVNPIKERSYVQSDRSRVEAFQKKLEQQGINATVRREMGRDIDGACGQLRRRYMEGLRT
jgi:23S rRNA (adenine2503-C2)-methyltransferase